MVASTPGTKAPSFELRGLDGESYSLRQALSQSPLLLVAFFKVSCPVCQFTFPYLERLNRAYPDVPLWGISQDDADATEAFARMFGITFPMLLDEALAATVDYGLTNVPSLFLLDREGTIKKTVVGFVKQDLEDLSQIFSEFSKQKPSKLFSEADEVPEMRPG